MCGLSIETIKPVYQAISSLDLENLDNLPINTLSQLQDSLITVLTRYEVSEVSMSLFCLAVLARLASWDRRLARCKGVSDNLHDDPLSPGQNLTTANQFFSTKRVSKTLDLVALKAIMICSSTCTLMTSIKEESLRLCTKIVQAIESRDRWSWAAKNSIKMTKLLEKALQPNLDDGVQWAVSLNCSYPLQVHLLTGLEALNFVIQLVEDRELAVEIVAAFETLVLRSHLYHLDSQDVHHLVI